MKLKCTPEDFQVEERVDLRPSSGQFGLYILTKESLGTPEAIDGVLQRWNLSRQQVAYAGLKDKHALTRQYITIKGGPRQGMRQTNLELEYVGQTGLPIHAKNIIANNFVVVVRHLVPETAAAIAGALEEVGVDGLPNYFDDQRFGSLGTTGEFIAKPWCLGDYERALWLAMADPNVHDTPEERDQKDILRKLWGQWPECKAALSKSHRRSVITYLADKPGDFKRALSIIRQDLRSIYLSAFQSDLWNEMLAETLRRTCRADTLVTRKLGRRDVPFFTRLQAEQRAQLHPLSLPLPSARLHPEEGPIKDLIDKVLAAEGLELRQIRLKYPRDTFFSRGERSAIFTPAHVSHKIQPDDIYLGKMKLTLRFELPRGTYATIVVKRVTGQGIEGESEPDKE